MQVTKNLTSVLPLAIILAGLLSYNFISAQWKSAPNNPPADNAEAPVNVSSSTQSKAGNFNANIVSAATSTWSPKYCDELGNNCFDPAQTNQQRTCPPGQFMRGINSDSTLVCSTATTTSPVSCTTQSTTVSSCSYSSGYMDNTPSCPVGWIPTGPSERGGRCSTNNETYTRTCIRTVCS